MTSEAGLLAGPFLSLKKGTRSVPKTGVRASRHSERSEDYSTGESCDNACVVITEPKSWGFSPIQ